MPIYGSKVSDWVSVEPLMTDLSSPYIPSLKKKFDKNKIRNNNEIYNLIAEAVIIIIEISTEITV